MTGTSKLAGNSTDAEKDLAKKAKQKFLENLRKFQEKATENKSSFHRSYRGSSDTQNGSVNNFRRSLRPTTTKTRVDLESLSRRSLRSRRMVSNREARDVDETKKFSSSAANWKSQAAAKKFSTQEDNETVKATTIEPTPQSQTSTLVLPDVFPGDILLEKRNESRHITHSQPLKPPLPQTLPIKKWDERSISVRTNRNSSSSSDEKFGSCVDDAEPAGLKDISNDRINTSFRHSSSSGSAVKSLSSALSESSVNITSAYLSHQRPDKSSNFSNFACSRFTKPSNQSNIPEELEQPQSKSCNSELIKELPKSREDNVRKHATPTSFSNNPLNCTANDETDIDFSIEEAINTFKRLSLEIDAIKHIGFRQSIGSPRLSAELPSSTKSKFSPVGDNTPENPITTESLTSPKSSAPPAENMLSEKLHLPGKTKSQLTSARERRREIRERREKENLKTSRESAAKNSTDGLAITKNQGPLSTSLNGQKFTNQRKNELQSTRDDRLKTTSSADAAKLADEPPESTIEFHIVTNHAVKSEPEFKTMPISVKGSTVSNTGSTVNFRKLTIAQRRKKLRQVLLNHKSNLLSDSELSSSFSDGSSCSSDIDMEWLEEGDTEGSVFSDTNRKTQSDHNETNNKPNSKGTPPVSNSSSSIDAHVTNGEPSPPSRTSVGNMMSMWETKAVTNSKPTRPAPVPEVGELRGKINGAKAVWDSPRDSPRDQTSAAVPQRRRMSFEEENVADGSDVDEEQRSRDVGSMLSMWENKLDQKTASASSKSAAADAEVGRKTVGKLKGAKDLFENLLKRTNDKEETRGKSGEISPVPISTPSINNMKSLFENKLNRQGNRAISNAPLQKGEQEKSSRSEDFSPNQKSKVLSFGDESIGSKSLQNENKIKDLSSQSSYSSGDELPSSLVASRCSTNRKKFQHSSSVNKNIASNAMESSSDDLSSSYKQKNYKPSNKSNIRTKISARKKRDRRPMTQPVTVDDVTSATQLIQNQKTTVDQSQDEERSTQEEEELSFSERLAFFNKLISKPTVGLKKDRSRTRRGSSRRHLTQPVDRDALEEVRELHSNTEKAEHGDELVQESSVGGLNNRPSKKEVTSLGAGEIFFPTFETERQKTSKAEIQEKTKKVGKLSSELRTKFLENNNQVESSTPNRTSTPSSQSTGFSETSSTSSLPTAPQSRAGQRSPSPLSESRLSTSRSEELNSEDSDMGKNRGVDVKATGSIHERLKLLEKNKEEGWRKRLKGDKKVVKSSLEDRMSKLHDSEDKWKKSKTTDPISPRSSSKKNANISDRLNSILANSENWKSKRGKQNDATQFTTEAKIAQRDGQKITAVSSTSSIKRKISAAPVSEEPVVTINDVSSNGPSLDKLSGVLKLSQKGLEPEVIKKTSGTTTEIPDLVDAGFENFFAAVTSPVDEPEKTLTNGVSHSDSEESSTVEAPAWLQEDPFEENQTKSSLCDIGRLKANVKRPSVRSKRSSRNPVRALAARTDIKQSYTEQRSNVTKLEQQRIAVVHGHAAKFTNAALAGLAYRADFSKVSLRSTKKTSAFSASDHKPWRDKMLLRVKGRRHVQTRLVAPTASSLNSGDAFLLILPQQLYAWFGEYSNVIEKAKVQEIADYIIHKGDMGSKATSLITIKEHSFSSIRAKEFWNLLGGRSEFEPSGGAKEDEVYEVNTEAAIKSYKLEDSKLIPYKPSWGKLPTMGQLSATSTYVFDFGAEMYIWHGKEVSFEDRQLAVKLARTLWDQGYDYTELGFCPFSPISKSSTDLKGERPEWGLFARVNENLETALVQEKFEDWSNIAREIGDRDEILKETSRGQVATEMKVKTNIAPDMTSCDVDKMHDHVSVGPQLLFEGYNVWKGHGMMYDDDGRGLEVHTSSVDMWHASDNAINLLDDANKGVFHRCETYVVRWRYVISSTGKWKAKKAVENLKSDPKGRERVAYFLWTGSGSNVNEKGASALMATEIDKDGGPQVVINEGREPPALCQCFNGGMIVTDGKKGSREGFYSWKLFCVRGGDIKDTILHQVPCSVSSLRSRNSFVALHGRSAKLVVWHGAKSPEKCRQMAEGAASMIQEGKKTCLGFRITCKSVSVTICEEENENEDFIEAVGRMRRSKYLSMTKSKPDPISRPKAWHLHPDSDQFVAKELEPVAMTQDDDDDDDVVTSCFPITQQQLKDLSKPALVLLENSEGIYLWQSGLAEELTGSSKRQYDISKRLAMETAVEYAKKFRSDVTPMIVHEHYEPVEFTNSFLTWKEPEKKLSFDERRANKPKPVADVLATISRLTYSLEELRGTPLPDGVDPNHLETYLSAADFVGLFEMQKDEFYSLPPWKQQKLRKQKNLF